MQNWFIRTYMPRNEGATGKTIVGGASLWITDAGSTEQQGGAWDFIKFALTPEIQAFWSINTGYYPVVQAAYELPEMQAALEQYPQFQVAIDQIRLADITDANTAHVSGIFVEKFFKDGSVRTYPGNTVICFAHPTSPTYQAGEALQKQLLEQPYGYKFVLLPASSFHMTVFSLILDQQRVPELWTSRLPLDAPLEAVDQFFMASVPGVAAPQHLRMCPTYLGGQGLSIRLSPADEETDDALVTYRNGLADATGVRYPDHITYKFHLTLAYQLMTLSDEETQAFADFRLGLEESLRCDVGVFETEAPVLTFFDDMFRFEPVEKRNLLLSRLES